jgi:hypothetical protein
MHQATVTAELGRLLALGGWRRSGSPAIDVASAGHQTAAPPAVPEMPWREVALRRDGARPLRLLGLLIHRTEVREAGGRSVLRLFATADGGAVAQLAYEPPDNCPARPVYRVARVGGSDDLRRFIDREGPEQCFAVQEAWPRSPLAHVACNRLRLPADIPGLARSDEFSPHTHEGNQ